jgi:hypothetical protein
MPRAYSTYTVAAAIDVSPKWLDNLLSHHDIPGVTGGVQGVNRVLSADAVVVLRVAECIMAACGARVKPAVDAATAIVREGAIQMAPGLRIVLDVSVFRVDLDGRLMDAVESAPRPRRGRPPAGR